MIVLKYLLEFLGFAMLGAAAVPVAMDLVNWYGRQHPETQTAPLEWRQPLRLAALSLIPMLAGFSIAIIPAGMAGVRVSQISGTLPETLYPGLHVVIPLVQSVETYDLRDQIYETTLLPDSKKGEGVKEQTLKVQTKEGLELGLAVTVRFRLDPHRLAYVHANLPQPVEQELVPPVVATAFRDLTPRYLVRELFAAKREEIRREAAIAIAQKLAPDAVIVIRSMIERGRSPKSSKIALCSESTGSMGAPQRRAAAMKTSPAETMHSLLASATGIPAASAAWRAGAWPRLAGNTQPMMTSVTSPGATPLCSSAALIAAAPRVGVGTPVNWPRKEPIAVRLAPTMTISDMQISEDECRRCSNPHRRDRPIMRELLRSGN